MEVPTDLVAFDQLPLAGLILELDGSIVAANVAICRLVGRAPEELLGRPLDVIVAGSVAPLLALGGRSRAIELELAGERGGVILEVVTAVLKDGDREYIQLFGVDVSARKLRSEVEAQHSAKQRAESLGIVAGGIAHDFNNLLVGVLAEASSAREDMTLPIQTIEAFRRIETSARKMAQLTRSMLAYAGRGRVDSQRIDPDGLLRDMNDTLSRIVRGNAKLVLTPSSETIAIEADAALLRQLIANLVANAFEANAARVEVTSRLVMRANAPTWQLEVSDDGEGIAAANLPRIFEPFFTTRGDQTGLGLSAAQGIVRRLGGELEVDSSPGNGARFRVRLPVLAGVEAPVRPTMKSMVPVATLKGVHVLIADDEPSVRSTVRRLMERRGATIHLAADGTEAETRLAAPDAGQLGLIILDVMMPGRTGYDVLATARRVCPGVPVILMSGYTEQAIGADGSRPDGFLEKPFTARQLDALIDQVMRETVRTAGKG